MLIEVKKTQTETETGMLALLMEQVGKFVENVTQQFKKLVISNQHQTRASAKT